jgi:antitoxin VapB
MPISIKNPKVEAMARTIAEKTGETLTQAVMTALQERLERIDQDDDIEQLVEEIMSIGQHCASLPVLDHRSADELLGYDESGLPS